MPQWVVIRSWPKTQTKTSFLPTHGKWSQQFKNDGMLASRRQHDIAVRESIADRILPAPS